MSTIALVLIFTGTALLAACLSSLLVLLVLAWHARQEARHD